MASRRTVASVVLCLSCLTTACGSEQSDVDDAGTGVAGDTDAGQPDVLGDAADAADAAPDATEDDTCPCTAGERCVDDRCVQTEVFDAKLEYYTIHGEQQRRGTRTDACSARPVREEQIDHRNFLLREAECIAWGHETDEWLEPTHVVADRDVGEVSLIGGRISPLAFEPNATNGCYSPEWSEEPHYDPGDALRLETTGGADSPPIALDMVVPAVPEAQLGEVVVGEPLAVTWEAPVNADTNLWILIGDYDPRFDRQVIIECGVEDDGAFEIPPNFTELFVEAGKTDVRLTRALYYHVEREATPMNVEASVWSSYSSRGSGSPLTGYGASTSDWPAAR